MLPSDLVVRREALGLTRQQLADALGVRHATVYRWELGRKDAPSAPIPTWLPLALEALERRAEGVRAT